MIGYWQIVVVVYRESGLRFVIFVDDHAPPHVHVYGDCAARINLIGPMGGPKLVNAVGMKASDLRQAVRIVGERQALLLKRWREIHA